MSPSFDVWHYFSNANWIVKGIMLILLFASITAWSLIIQKMRQLTQLARANHRFIKQFGSGMSLQALFQQLTDSSKGQQMMATSTLGTLFCQGFKTFSHWQTHPSFNDPEWPLLQTEQAMEMAHQQQQQELSQHLGWLATIGSTAPYVGLLGTVVGIISAFTQLGTETTQATLTLVAPGIAEALVATAMGLVAAIPATVAYNRLSQAMQTLNDEHDRFQQQFVEQLYRQTSVESFCRETSPDTTIPAELDTMGV